MALIPVGWRPRPATLVFVERGLHGSTPPRTWETRALPYASAVGEAPPAEGSEVLLIRKKRGHGAGKVNAPGGRVEPRETPEECARRELFEEVRIRCGELRPAAHLRFHDRTDGHDVRGFVFRTCEFRGAAGETPEAEPFWCSWDAIPYGQMWAADRYWVPWVRAGNAVRGDFVFEGERLVCSAVSPVGAGGMGRFRAEFEGAG